MKHNKYFGTDGVRGKVGNIPITPDFILKLGWAAGKVLTKHGSHKIIIGKDTRISGDMLESSLTAGLFATGLSIIFTGPMPTPAIAYLTRTFNAEAGIVISASHNPFYDNGVKFFSQQGTKLSVKTEEEIETELTKPLSCVESINLGKSSYIYDAPRRYIDFCKSTFPKNINLIGLKIIVDCANGATYHIAPHVLTELGAEVITIGCEPNGININQGCGTTDISLLQNMVLIEKADLGIVYDGDGDRVIMVDHMGSKVDGDQILYIIARDKLNHDQLFGGVVGTTMSNAGLEIALKKLGIPFIRTHIGDRYVLEMMQEKGWCIGAENSGHVILLDHMTTGDGIIAGLQVLSIMITNRKTLHDLCVGMKLLPQVLVNVHYLGKSDPLISTCIKETISKAKRQLTGRYDRIFLHKSGTEPLIRIMVEGEEQELIHRLAYYIADAIKTLD